MAISSKAKQKSNFTTYTLYGGANFEVVPQINLDNEQKKVLGIKTHREKNSEGEYVEVEKDFVTNTATKWEEDSKTGKNKKVEVEVDYPVYEFEFYFKFRNPEKHLVTVPEGIDEISVRKFMKDTSYTKSFIVEFTECEPSKNKGSLPFIDNDSNVQWATSEENLKAERGFDPSTARIMYKGENELLRFVNNILGFEGAGLIIDWKKITSEDYSDITDALLAGKEKFENIPDSPFIPDGITALLYLTKSESNGKVFINENIYINKFIKGNSVRNYKAIKNDIEYQTADKDRKGKPKYAMKFNGWYNDYVGGLYIYDNELDGDSSKKVVEEENLPF